MISVQIFEDTASAFRYRSDRELQNAMLLFRAIGSPFIARHAMTLTKRCLAWHLPVKGMIKATIFRQFCGGETLDEALRTADRIYKHGVSAILDYGAEQKETETDFDKAKETIIAAINSAAGQKSISFTSIKITSLARYALLEKKHLALPLSTAEEQEWQRVYRRVHHICTIASECNISVLVDAEETWIQDPVNELTVAMMALFNRRQVMVYNTFQLYCWATLPFLEDALRHAQEQGYLLGAKLVRGAYMEKERARAWKIGYPNPIQSDKEATDRDFDEAVLFCLQHLEHLAVFIGTHNETSSYNAILAMEALGIARNDNRVSFSQLFGMSDHISFNLAAEGFNVSKYLPYGPVKEVMPYLVRRAEENTSVAGQSGRELTNIRTELKRRKLNHAK